MADESTDVASKEELSICGRWLEKGKAVEHFLCIVHVKEVNAEAFTRYLLQFLSDKGLSIGKVCGLGFDGASTMSGAKSGVQIRLRYHSPSSLYVHCRCHQLQLAVIHAAKEHSEVMRVLGTLLTMWKAFHYSDTRWLARERCVRAVRQTLPALVATFEKIHDDCGDAEAFGIAKLMCTYKFVACLYMLCDVVHTVAKLQGSLQSKVLDLATVPILVQSTISRLTEIKEILSSSTWFKDHVRVFTDPCQLGTRNIIVSETDQETFLRSVYRPYIQSVIDHITSRLKSSDVFSAFSVFDPSNLPDSEESLSFYGTEKIKILTDFYGHEQQVSFQGEIGHSRPDVDPEQSEAEWKIYRRIMFAKFKNDTGGNDSVSSTVHQRINFLLKSGVYTFFILSISYELLRISLTTITKKYQHALNNRNPM